MHVTMIKNIEEMWNTEKRELMYMWVKNATLLASFPINTVYNRYLHLSKFDPKTVIECLSPKFQK